jgi:hypothetical protein
MLLKPLELELHLTPTPCAWSPYHTGGRGELEYRLARGVGVGI